MVRKLLRYWLPVVAWAAVISALSTGTLHGGFTRQLISAALQFFIPDVSVSTIALVHTMVRKGAHLAEYFVLGLLLWRAFRADAIARWRWRWAVNAFLLALAFAGLDEFHQSFEPGRTASELDVGFDATGAALAQLWRRWRTRPSRPL